MGEGGVLPLASNKAGDDDAEHNYGGEDDPQDKRAVVGAGLGVGFEGQGKFALAVMAEVGARAVRVFLALLAVAHDVVPDAIVGDAAPVARAGSADFALRLAGVGVPVAVVEVGADFIDVFTEVRLVIREFALVALVAAGLEQALAGHALVMVLTILTAAHQPLTGVPDESLVLVERGGPVAIILAELEVLDTALPGGVQAVGSEITLR